MRSKTIARELLVPWSNDKMYCSISFGFMIVAESLSGGSRQTSDYKSTKKISFRIKTVKFFFSKLNEKVRNGRLPFRMIFLNFMLSNNLKIAGMKIIKIERNNRVCAVVESDETVVADVQSALELLMNVSFDAGTKSIAIAKNRIHRDFFILSTGVAGEILQKYVNYGGRIAIYGDFSSYTSKPLKDFMYESNKGANVFFVATKEEAVNRLTS